MKEYGDETFIYEMVHKEGMPQYEGNDIRNGIAIVGERSIPFCERCVIENRLYVTIPAEFEPIPLWMIKKRYPYDTRPDVVFCENEKTLKSLNFWIKDNLPEDSKTETVLEQILARVNPEYKIANTILICNFFEFEQDMIDEIRVGHFELVTVNGDKEISDLMFFFPFDGQYIVGSFKCISVELTEWTDVVVQILKTMRIV